MSSAWEDIGYRARNDREDREWKPLRIPFSNGPKLSHEPRESTEARRLRSLKAVLAVLPDAVVQNDGIVAGSIPGAKFEFWPASDTWSVHSSKGVKYGKDIQKICDQIAYRLLELKKIMS